MSKKKESNLKRQLDILKMSMRKTTNINKKNRTKYSHLSGAGLSVCEDAHVVAVHHGHDQVLRVLEHVGLRVALLTAEHLQIGEKEK